MMFDHGSRENSALKLEVLLGERTRPLSCPGGVRAAERVPARAPGLRRVLSLSLSLSLPCLALPSCLALPCLGLALETDVPGSSVRAPTAQAQRGLGPTKKKSSSCARGTRFCEYVLVDIGSSPAAFTIVIEHNNIIFSMFFRPSPSPSPSPSPMTVVYFYKAYRTLVRACHSCSLPGLCWHHCWHQHH